MTSRSRVEKLKRQIDRLEIRLKKKNIAKVVSKISVHIYLYVHVSGKDAMVN